MRQVGYALHMYGNDFGGRLGFTNENDTVNFNEVIAHDNPLKLLRPYVGVRDPTAGVPLYVCPGAEPSTKPKYAPLGNSSTAMMMSHLVLEKGFEKILRPAKTVIVQENYVLMNALGMSRKKWISLPTLIPSGTRGQMNRMPNGAVPPGASTTTTCTSKAAT